MTYDDWNKIRIGERRKKVRKKEKDFFLITRKKETMEKKNSFLIMTGQDFLFS